MPSTAPVSLQPSQVSAPHGKAGRHTFPGPDCLLVTLVGGPLPGVLGRQTCASFDSPLFCAQREWVLQTPVPRPLPPLSL